MSIYPLRLSRTYWKIPLYCYHECDEGCSMIFTFDDAIELKENEAYNEETGLCSRYNDLISSIVPIMEFDTIQPKCSYGKMYEPDACVIPDTDFDIDIMYPLTHPVRSKISTSVPLTLVQITSIVCRLYDAIYEQEEKTATPTPFTLTHLCDCGIIDTSIYINIIDEYKDCSNNCSICYCSLSNGAIKLDCDHIFHRECIMQWANNGGTSCPLCRSLLYKCSVCDGTNVVTTTEEFVVMPFEYRTYPSFRNITNGVFGIFDYDLESLCISSMVYNREQKLLKVFVIGV